MKNLQPPLPSFISIYIVLYFISCASDPTVNPRQLPQQNDLGVEVECRVDQDCSPQEECNRQGVCVTNIGVDVDRDGVPDAIDNCPHLSNSGQEDCDQNGVGDACDPAGSCGSQLSLSTFRLDQNNNRYPLPCTYVEFENSNFRAQTNVIGSVNLYIPRSLPKQYLKLYSGLVQGNDLEKRCVPATKIMKSAFEQVPLSTYVLDREQLLAINPNQNLSLQVTARGFGKIKGQVLLADRSAHQSQHGGIRVYVKGYEKTSTLSDPYGHFTLNHVPADQNHTLVFAYDGYTILELTQQRVDNQHVLSIDAHVLDGGGDHLFECRDQLSTTTCITNETSNHTCQSCDQHTQCDEFELCIRSVLSNALVLYPANPGEEIDKDVRIKVQILTIPTHQEQYQIDPNPTLTIKTTYDGMITQVPLTYMASESTDQISIYRYNTRLKMGDVYQMLVEANDQTRIMVARKEGFSIEPSNSSEEIEEEFLLIPYRSQLDGTFDEDADSIIDQEDIDQDGDGCVDDWDRFPRNPFLCLDEDVLDLENFYEGSDGQYDGFRDIESEIQSSDHTQLFIRPRPSERILTIKKMADVNRIYAHPYPSIIQAHTTPIRVALQEGDHDVQLEYYIHRPIFRSLSDFSRPNQVAYLTPADCSINEHSGTRSERCPLQMYALDCNSETALNHQFESCKTQITLPAQMQGDYIIWSTDMAFAPSLTNEIPNTQVYHTPLQCDVCLANHSHTQSVYGLIKRALLDSSQCLPSRETLNLDTDVRHSILSLSPKDFSTLAVDVCTPIEYADRLMSSEDCLPKVLFSSNDEALLFTHLSIHYQGSEEIQRELRDTCGSLGIDFTNMNPKIELTADCSALLEDKTIEIHFTLSDSQHAYVLHSNPSELNMNDVSVLKVKLGDLYALCKSNQSD